MRSPLKACLNPKCKTLNPKTPKNARGAQRRQKELPPGAPAAVSASEEVLGALSAAAAGDEEGLRRAEGSLGYRV